MSTPPINRILLTTILTPSLLFCHRERMCCRGWPRPWPSSNPCAPSTTPPAVAPGPRTSPTSPPPSWASTGDHHLHYSHITSNSFTNHHYHPNSFIRSHNSATLTTTLAPPLHHPLHLSRLDFVVYHHSRHVGRSLGHQWLGPEAYSGTSAGGVHGGSKYFAFEAPMHLPSYR